MNLSQGYVVDLPYNSSFFKDITPSYIRSLLLLKGMDLPKRKEEEPFRYLELGYGQGISLSVHAVSNEGEFYGTDFNPEHAIIAKKALHGTGVKTNILNDSFEELYNKSQNGLLPEFDMIVFHGIWSWIDRKNQDYILNIISKNLKVGGIVYVSYNAMPGWSSFMPVRELLFYHGESISATQSSVAKIKNAYSFISQMEKCGASYFSQNPMATQRLKNLEQHSLSYLVHEYMNANWQILYFKDVANDMEKSKCSFFGSTRLLTQLSISLPPEILPILAETQDVKLRETMRDFALNTQFRCDLFVKGKNILNTEEFNIEFYDQKFVLVVPINLVKYEIQGLRGTMKCKEELYKPMVEFLSSKQHSPKSLGEIKALTVYKDMNISNFTEIISVLLAANYIHPAIDASQESIKACNKLNTFYCQKSLLNNYTDVLASPVLGGAINISRVEQMFLYFRENKSKTPNDYAEETFKQLQSQEQSIVTDGKTLSEDEGKKHLQEIATKFENTTLPILKSLKVDIEVHKTRSWY